MKFAFNVIMSRAILYVVVTACGRLLTILHGLWLHSLDGIGFIRVRTLLWRVLIHMRQPQHVNVP